MGMNRRVGIVGKRGLWHVDGVRSVEGVDVTCYFDPDPATHRLAAEKGIQSTAESFEALLDTVDAVVIGSPMHLHASQSMQALADGKHVLCEVTAAVSLEECWQLLDAANYSDAIYMFAENYCFFEDNLIVRELARRGEFGDITFGEGEYIHEVRWLQQHPDGAPTWRHFWQTGRRGNTYITHELGPVMQWFREADQHDRITSVTCFGTGAVTAPQHQQDDTTITMIQTASGRLIKVRLDMMSNRPEMISYSLQGTGGVYESGRGGGVEARVWFGEGVAGEKREWAPLHQYRELLDSELKEEIDSAKEAGHGGSDLLTGRSFGKLVLTDEPNELDIHAALEWTAAGLCSQISIEAGSVPVVVPDFKKPEQRPTWIDGRP